MEPCCETMRQQVEHQCSQHGKDCPNMLVRWSDFHRRYLLIAENGAYGFTHCPWCGTQVQEPEEDADDGPMETDDQRKHRQWSFDSRLRKVLADRGHRFISKQVGRDANGVYIEAGAFVNEVVYTRKVYKVGADIWTDEMVQAVADAFGKEEPC